MKAALLALSVLVLAASGCEGTEYQDEIVCDGPPRETCAGFSRKDIGASATGPEGERVRYPRCYGQSTYFEVASGPIAAKDGRCCLVMRGAQDLGSSRFCSD